MIEKWKIEVFPSHISLDNLTVAAKHRERIREQCRIQRILLRTDTRKIRCMFQRIAQKTLVCAKNIKWHDRCTNLTRTGCQNTEIAYEQRNY